MRGERPPRRALKARDNRSPTVSKAASMIVSLAYRLHEASRTVDGGFLFAWIISALHALKWLEKEPEKCCPSLLLPPLSAVRS